MIAARDLRVGDELRDEAGRLVSTIVTAPQPDPHGARLVTFTVRRAWLAPGGRTQQDVVRFEPPGRLLPFTRPERTDA